MKKKLISDTHAGLQFGEKNNLLGKKYIEIMLKYACNYPQKNRKQTKIFWAVLNPKTNYEIILKLSYKCHLNYKKKLYFHFMRL